jgi:hypothetical protein
MKSFGVLLLFSCFLTLGSAAAHADSSGRIHGTITTVDGEVYEGLIRWDKNEASWFDILNGNKKIRDGHRVRSRERIRVFGITIGERMSSGDLGSAQSGLCFGHLQSLEPAGGDAARLVLKSGQTITLEGGSSDIGRGIRGIVIEDAAEGETSLDWDDIERIEFSQGAANLASQFGERLYGTLTTRRGDEFTGWVSWDVDELFTEDILDGAEGRRDRKVRFGKLASIERRSSSSATLVFLTGKEMVLRGTNDVDRGNRGIAIYDPGFGQVTVDWSEFARLDLKTPPAQPAYKDFDGGRPLEGTVFTADGKRHDGTIRWDDDETHTWEILDGDSRGASFDVEFGAIKEIKREGFRAAAVTTWGGRTLRLGGSNDVDGDNRGIYVKSPDGKEVKIDWDEFDRVEFVR